MRLLLPLLLSTLTSLAQQKPNIIYIYADDLGYGEIGCYGQNKIKTPFLDQMATEGIRFTQHYTSAPVCAPARASLMTGKHTGHSYIRGNLELGGFEDSSERGQKPPPDEAFTMAELLKQQGYTTALIGKWGLGMPFNGGSPLRHGFDYYYGYLDQKQAHNYYPSHLWENDHWDTLAQPYFRVHRKIDSATATQKDFDAFKGKDYAPQKITEKALNFIDRESDHPFFLYLPYTIPHLSLQVPDEWVNKYRGQFDEKPYYGQKGYSPHQFPLSAYAAMISYLDAQVGLILQKLKEKGIDNNTFVFFSSDNGATFTGGVDAKFFNSSAGFRGLKMDLYEGGIRMALLARWPGKIKPGTVSDHLSAQYDMLATVREIVGSKQTIKTDGISMLATLLGKSSKQKKHEFLYFEYPENGGQVAVRYGDWKAIKHSLIKNPNSPWQLYNLREDRAEKNDLASKNPKILKLLNQIVQTQHQNASVTEWNFLNLENFK